MALFCIFNEHQQDNKPAAAGAQQDGELAVAGDQQDKLAVAGDQQDNKLAVAGAHSAADKRIMKQLVPTNKHGRHDTHDYTSRVITASCKS